jgi:ABC-2 type transport system permease protein
MRAFIAFTKKEFTENFRTCRTVVLTAAFLLLGLMSPFVAKIIPELLSGTDLGGGLIITMPDPTYMDSWAQFFGNVGQMGMLVLIITFCGITANELSRGTLINLLTKGMKRGTAVLSKFFTASVIWAGGYLLCLAVCYVYTKYYWDSGPLKNAFLAFISPWLFGEMIIALLIFGGILFGNIYGSLIGCFGLIVIMITASMIPQIRKYSPAVLAGGAIDLLNAQKEAADFIPAAVVCVVLIVLILVVSIIVFNRKRI